MLCVWPCIRPLKTECVFFAEGWKPLACQREECTTHPESNEVVKLCLDHRLAINENSVENGPMLALCYDCSEEARDMEPPVSASTQEASLIDLLLPMTQVSVLCDSSVTNNLL